MKNIFTYLSVISLLIMPMTAGAQALPFVATQLDAHSLSMAGADAVQTSSVANSAFTNAAVIPFYEKQADISVDYTLWQPSAAKVNAINVAGAYNLNSKFGVAAGLRYGMYPSYPVAGDSGVGKDTFSPSEIQANVGFAWRFLPYLSVGANVGYASSTVAKGYSYGAVTSDVFVMSKISDFKVALGVSNLGSQVKSASGAAFPLPSSVTLGAGYDKVLAQKHGIDVLLDADYYFTGGFSAALGAGYTFDKMVSVRAGYRYGTDTILPSFASVGVGVNFIGIKLDLAYLIAVSDSPLKNTLSVGVGYSF